MSEQYTYNRIDALKKCFIYICDIVNYKFYIFIGKKKRLFIYYKFYKLSHYKTRDVNITIRVFKTLHNLYKEYETINDIYIYIYRIRNSIIIGYHKIADLKCRHEYFILIKVKDRREAM